MTFDELMSKFKREKNNLTRSRITFLSYGSEYTAGLNTGHFNSHVMLQTVCETLCTHV